MTVSSAVFALAPKCPICLFAYFGVFGVATSTAAAYRAWLPPLTALWLAVTVGMMIVGRREGRSWGPLLLGLAAGTAVFTGKFLADQPIVVYAGIGALTVAVVWNAFSGARAAAAQCSECNERPLTLDHDAR